MTSPVQDQAGSCKFDDEFELHYTDDLTVEEIEEMFKPKNKDQDKDNTSSSTKTEIKNNTIDGDEMQSTTDSAAVTNNATGPEDGREGRLTEIDGKLHTLEPETGRICSMDTMPQKFKEFRQWLKDECRVLDKKHEWIKWIMDLPLDPSELDDTCLTPFKDLKGPEEVVHRSVVDLHAIYNEMEHCKKERDKDLRMALVMDLDYRLAKKDIKYCTMVIKKSLERDDESLSEA
ncbi:hypothetical protein BHE90_000674 [Fusarium euwallaceae]|uniref:Uncharacterized protein n=1 Tax=Fusarium euwallaceae TaxID=1147111 RepID=A0A430M9R9_9HYPO|nr:hypothetical protein BHE90_000674 [Fusarium euwallaceae]